jgi:NOL1/NOP2/fmu family ribosome biogenesis protein
MKPLNNKQKKKILERLNEQYGIQKLPFLILQFGEEKLRLYSGNLSKEELQSLDKNLNIENIGLYFAKWERDDIRLTIDGVQLFKSEINKNITELDENNANNWLKGHDLDIKEEKGWKIIKYKNEFLGCGKSTGERITNFVPKERRIKN